MKHSALFIGCGKLAERRAEGLPAGLPCVGGYDVNQERAQAFCARFGGKAFADLPTALRQSGATAAIVGTINSALASSAKTALEAGLHVLVEKPAARSIRELEAIQVPEGRVFKVGFNHRFHPAFARLREEIAKRPDDALMYIRARYGNGGRLGFEREWRANVELAGGGELLDQGVHVLDLASVLLPQWELRQAWVRTQYWQMPVDDNAWALLEGPHGETLDMHVSSSEWKNEFLFEVYTRARKYVWSGIGRSYGPQTLTIYTMKPEMGPPDVAREEFGSGDNSIADENKQFLAALEGREKAWGDFNDTRRCLQLIEAIYAHSEKLKAAKPHPQRWQPA